jgi:glyoxylase-like metal-dependent hydrolase (beta-lactamase superfamily II)
VVLEALRERRVARGVRDELKQQYPGYWRHLTEAVDALGTSLEALRAVILTHHHFDHVGTAERLRSTCPDDHV